MSKSKKFCIHSDGLGYCDILSDDKTRQYCVEGPCPHEQIVEYMPVVYITCPFCGREHKFKPWLNVICPCGAKYYLKNRSWLDRKTGERRKSDEGD